jgi:hypothetical protein
MGGEPVAQRDECLIDVVEQSDLFMHERLVVDVLAKGVRGTLASLTDVRRGFITSRTTSSAMP